MTSVWDSSRLGPFTCLPDCTLSHLSLAECLDWCIAPIEHNAVFLFIFYLFIYPGKFVVLSVPLWISFFEGQLMISGILAFCAASEMLTFNPQFGEIPQSDAQASTCTVKTPLNRPFPRWTPVLPVIREGWWDEPHCSLPLLTSVNSNCQLVKEPQKVRQLSSGTSIHCEFQQEGGAQREEEQRDEHCLFFFLFFFSRKSWDLFLFHSSVPPLSVDELVIQIIQLLSALFDCPTEAVFMAYKFYGEICLTVRRSHTH